MKYIICCISLCFVLVSSSFKTPETIKPISQSHQNTASKLQNGFYWIANGLRTDETLKMDLAKQNETFVVERTTVVKQNQIKSLEIGIEKRNGKTVDVLTFILDAQARTIFEAVKPNFAIKQDIGFVLNGKLIFVALFFAPFKGNRMAFYSTNYSKAELTEIKEAFDGSSKTAD